MVRDGVDGVVRVLVSHGENNTTMAWWRLSRGFLSKRVMGQEQRAHPTRLRPGEITTLVEGWGAASE